MMKTMFVSIILLFCALLPANIAQYYTFSTGTETYTEITGTPVTWVGSTTGDDSMTGPIELGFTLTYGTATYTQVKVCSNGYITLGDVPGQSNQNHLDSLAICPVIAGLWDDLHAGRVQSTTNPVTSSVQTMAAGSAGHRTFVVQYKNVYWDYLTEPRNSYVDFQIVIKENNGIEIKYGPNSTTNPRPLAGASIGMSMLPGGVQNFFSVTPGTPPTVSTVIENDTVRVHVPAGTCYYFYPAVQNDMAATAIDGESYPSMGIASDYTVSIANVGSVPQTIYSVKLMNGTTVLASVAGTPIAIGETRDVVIPWTPAVAGVVSLYGKVVLATDENAQNDQTEPMTVVIQNIIGNVAGTVRRLNNQPIGGATITAGTFTATTTANGMYVLHLPMATYDITASAPGYEPHTEEAVFVIAGQTVTLNYNLGPVANEDDLLVTSTALQGNYPNPFRPQTTVNYTVKGTSPVSLEIYNLKGQLVRTLVNETKATGNYSAVWDGRDSDGKQVSGGVYHYRMQSGDYSATRRMLLLN